jgi:anti-anti-sigma regulatory factor
MGDVKEDIEGTLVTMEININSLLTTKEVFDKYSDDDLGFTRTIIPVRLVKYGNENLVSRSQAKRLLARFEKFKEVILDFDRVETIGQAFADEIFRVFQQHHPQVHIMYTNVNEEVERSIKRATQGGFLSISVGDFGEPKKTL